MRQRTKIRSPRACNLINQPLWAIEHIRRHADHVDLPRCHAMLGCGHVGSSRRSLGLTSRIQEDRQVTGAKEIVFVACNMSVSPSDDLGLLSVVGEVCMGGWGVKG